MVVHNEIIRKTPSGCWDANTENLSFLYEHRHDREAVCEKAHPHIVMNVGDVINEATYKEITTLIDDNFLSQKVRADALSGIFHRGFDDNTMIFEVNSSEYETNRIRYRNLIQFDQWNEVGQDTDLDFAEKSRMLLWAGDIRLHCTCPSFLYYGFNYILTVLDSAIWPEERKPVVRNPNDRGVVCKHLRRVLQVLPFYSGDISTALRSQFGT